MVLEEELVGIEIKSEMENTYARLSRQVKDYDRFFRSELCRCRFETCSSRWGTCAGVVGIITVEELDGACDFYVLRKAEKNPKQKMLHKIKLLWRLELARIFKK